MKKNHTSTGNDIQPEKMEERQHDFFINQNPDGLYSLDVNGKFTSGNEGIVAILGLPLPELLKTDFLQFCAPKDKERTAGQFLKTVNGESCKFEAAFISAKGRDMVLQISLMPIILDAKVVGAYGIAKDMTDLRETQRIMVKKGRFLKTQASFISSLMEKELDVHSMKESFALVGEALEVDRMFYFKAFSDSNEKMFLSLKIEWINENAASQIGNPDFLDIPVQEVEEFTGQLKKNQPVNKRFNKSGQSLLEEKLRSFGIKALLLFPIFVNESFFGIIGFEDFKEEREWENTEIDFLKGLVFNTSSLLEKRKTEELLQEKQKELTEINTRYRLAITAGQDLIPERELQRYF